MSKPRPTRKDRATSDPPSATRRATARPVPSAATAPTISGKWLLSSIAIAVIAAILCAWATLCILFWQGSWQLLYHPASTVSRTPASANLPFNTIGFATNASGEPQLSGWWIPAPQAHYTAIYLHGASGNLGNTIDTLAQIHSAGLNLFAFDYRGYGQSRFIHPSEASLREDANSAIRYLTGTRHIPESSIILIGSGLGANLALEVASTHPDLAGVVVEDPLDDPTGAIFHDPRARFVPAHLFVRDRWDSRAAASNLLIPSLWLCWTTPHKDQNTPATFQAIPARKTLVWLTNSAEGPKQFSDGLTSWLDQLPAFSR